MGGEITLILQTASHMNNRGGKVLYISGGEESLKQIKMRAGRLMINQNLLVASAAELGPVMELIKKADPDILIIDSIQAMYNEESDGIPGSINQVKEVTAALIQWAKREDTIVFLIGHVTKEGGPWPDPSCWNTWSTGGVYLEGERYHSFRVLRGGKEPFRLHE